MKQYNNIIHICTYIQNIFQNLKAKKVFTLDSMIQHTEALIFRLVLTRVSVELGTTAIVLFL